jgi:hypothetical protein
VNVSCPGDDADEFALLLDPKFFVGKLFCVKI